jgi:hypothetical protein
MDLNISLTDNYDKLFEVRNNLKYKLRKINERIYRLEDDRVFLLCGKIRSKIAAGQRTIEVPSIEVKIGDIVGNVSCYEPWGKIVENETSTYRLCNGRIVKKSNQDIVWCVYTEELILQKKKNDISLVTTKLNDALEVLDRYFDNKNDLAVGKFERRVDSDEEKY